jgi:cell division transport system permease protein
VGRLWFFIREAFRTLRRNAAPSVAATVTIGVSFVLLGVLIPIFQTTQGKSQEVRDQLELKVFLFQDATPAETSGLRERIAQSPHVESVEYVSKTEAVEILKGRLDDPDILSELNSNPLPASFNVKPDDAANLAGIRQDLTPLDPSGKPQPVSPIIDKVVDSRDEAETIEEVTGSLKIVLTVLTVLLIVASLGLVANTIRLSIFARRREIEVMRLVGATRWFVRWPFMIEGMLVGLAGGVAAVFVLWLGKVVVLDPLSGGIGRIASDDTVSFTALVAILLLASMLVAAIGSGMTLRRFLRV